MYLGIDNWRTSEGTWSILNHNKLSYEDGQQLFHYSVSGGPQGAYAGIYIKPTGHGTRYHRVMTYKHEKSTYNQAHYTLTHVAFRNVSPWRGFMLADMA